MEMNAAQRAAVEHASGPLVVSAGAGSGKTTVLVARMVRALLGEDAQPLLPGATMSITFTRKAAAELSDRVARRLREVGRSDLVRSLDEMWVGTIHAVCSRLLKEVAVEAGIDPGFTVIDEVAAQALKIDAFETAVGSLTDTDERVAHLFERHGYRAVLQATDTLASLLGRGLIPDWTRATKTPEDVWNLARAAFSLALERFAQVIEESGGAKIPKTLETVSSQVLSVLDALDAFDPSDDGFVSMLSVELLSFPAGTRQGSWRGKDVLVELLESYSALAGMLAAIEADAQNETLERLARSYMETFRTLKRAGSMLDYDDLENLAGSALSSGSGIAERFSGRFGLVQIDEFQDTNETQRTLVQRLRPEGIVTVGDVQQSIYAFRGADVDVYRRHVRENRARGGTTIALDTNYRSHESILAFANSVFGRESGLGNDFLELAHGRDESKAAHHPEGFGRLSLILADVSGLAAAGAKARGARTVAEAMAERVARLIEAGVKPNDIVMLFSASTRMPTYAAALAERGVESVITAGSGFFSHRMVGVVECMARVLANPDDDLALSRLLASDVFSMDDSDLLRVSSSAREARTSFFSVLSSTESRVAMRAHRVIDAVVARLGTEPLSSSLRAFVEASGFDLVVLASGQQGRQDYAVLMRVLKLADSFESSGGGGPAGFVSYLDEQVRFGRKEGLPALPAEGAGVVRLMTIHAAKGLEFPYVFVPELDKQPLNDTSMLAYDVRNDLVEFATKVVSPDDELAGSKLYANPAYESLMELAHARVREEFKRQFYVAATRAREALILGATVDPENPAKSPMMEALVGAFYPELAIPVEPHEVSLASGVAVQVEVVVVTDEDEPGGEEDDGFGAVGSQEGDDAFDFGGFATSVARGVAVEAPSRISYSGFSEYRSCPRRFHAERVLRLGELRLPDDRGGSTAFGSAFHALAEIAGRAGKDQAFARVDAVATYHGLPSEARSSLLDALDAWLESDIAREVAAFERISYEAPFALALPTRDLPPLMLDGAIDLLATSGKAAHIVDYKTGGTGAEEKSRPYSELEERYRLQSECYALAAFSAGAEDVTVTFFRPQVSAPAVSEVRFVYRSADKGRIERSLLSLYGRMCAGEYDPLGKYDEKVCGTCPIAGSLCATGVRRHIGTY